MDTELTADVRCENCGCLLDRADPLACPGCGKLTHFIAEGTTEQTGELPECSTCDAPAKDQTNELDRRFPLLSKGIGVLAVIAAFLGYRLGYGFVGAFLVALVVTISGYGLLFTFNVFVAPIGHAVGEIGIVGVVMRLSSIAYERLIRPLLFGKRGRLS